jgi:xanthine dehydrogenase YagS FAD-binding subunit
MVVRNRGGERAIPAASFFMQPSVDIERMTVLDADDLLVAVRLPAAWAAAEHWFEKVTDRGSWDFALVSVAASFRTSGDTIDDARIVCGGVECIPRRMTAVERAVRGRVRGEELANEVAALASRGAEALRFNQYKLPLTENLVRRAVRG